MSDPPLPPNAKVDLKPAQSSLFVPASQPASLKPQRMAPPTTGSATGNPRNKTALKPGHSLMDWIRLGSSGVDLTGTGGVITAVSHAELAKHNQPEDCWLALRGRVYNITRYMEFHPGGRDELMRGAGKDATALFDSVHAWVNYEQLLSKCLVGPLRTTATINLSNNSSKSTVSPPAPSEPSSAASTPKSAVVPRFDWIQKSEDILLTFYTRALSNPGLVVQQLSESATEVRIFVDSSAHVHRIKFAHDVRWPCTARLNVETGKIELLFVKSSPSVWTNYGTMEKTVEAEGDGGLNGYEFEVQAREEITHDSRALLLRPKDKLIFITPIGYHVNLTGSINGTTITRSYTPIPNRYSPVPTSLASVALLVKASGAFSQHITRDYPSMAAEIRVSRPIGTFQLSSVRDQRRIGLLAAGSGLTPMLGLIDYLLRRAASKLEVIQLLCFNKMEKDIWCRGKLDEVAKDDDRLIVRHTLSTPTDAEWRGEKGLVSKEQLLELTDRARKDHVTFIAVCGPVSFNNLCSQYLREINFSADNVHFFQG